MDGGRYFLEIVMANIEQKAEGVFCVKLDEGEVVTIKEYAKRYGHKYPYVVKRIIQWGLNVFDKPVFCWE